MAEIYKFFNSTTDDQRKYQAADFAEYFNSVLSTGLLHTDENPGMEVNVEAGTLNTVVSSGRAIMRGYFYENTSDLTLEHAVPESDLDRIDRVVLRWDSRNQSRFIKLFVLEGDSAEDPEPPELQRDNFIYEVSLAQIYVNQDTASLQQEDVTDERLDEDLCGLVHSLISIPTSQFLEEWEEFIDGVKDEGFTPYPEFRDHKTDDEPHQYGPFAWRYNSSTGTLDLVVDD
ncbi:hypothetical protein [Alkalicoccus chagannorensis]|uniref:hypothetical protein n=1 Tax=Alkalicoccus chagannorensis TaxID=427072 RepID=UPI00041CAEBB|nr:hypothetical protein [Alkalicoccus chagannorensis]